MLKLMLLFLLVFCIVVAHAISPPTPSLPTCTGVSYYVLDTVITDVSSVFDGGTETYLLDNVLSSPMIRQDATTPSMVHGVTSTTGYNRFALGSSGYTKVPTQDLAVQYSRMVFIPGVCRAIVSSNPGNGPSPYNTLLLYDVSGSDGSLSNPQAITWSDTYTGNCNLLSASAHHFFCYDGAVIHKYLVDPLSNTITHDSDITLVPPTTTAVLPHNTCGGSCQGGTFAWDGENFYFATNGLAPVAQDYEVYNSGGIYQSTHSITTGGAATAVFFDWSAGRYMVYDSSGVHQQGTIYSPVTTLGGVEDSAVYGGVSVDHLFFTATPAPTPTPADLCETFGEIVSAESIGNRFLGWDVSITDDWLFATQSVDVNLDGTHAVIFKRTGPTTWQESQSVRVSLSPSSESTGDTSVVVRSETAVVCVASINRCVALRYNGAQWITYQHIAITTYENFGADVDMCGNTLIIGAPGYAQSSGRAYVYTRKDQVSLWKLHQTLEPLNSAIDQQFGFAVELDLEWIAVGAPFANANDGYVELWRLKNNNLYELDQTLTTAYVTGAEFGYSLTMTNGTMGIGAPGASFTYPPTTPTFIATNTGGLSIWEISGNTWTEVVLFPSIMGEDNARFGHSVQFDGTKGAVSAPGENGGRGRTYIIRQNDLDFVYYLAGVVDDNFGWAVDFSQSGYLAIGITGADVEPGNAWADEGAVSVHECVATTVNTNCGAFTYSKSPSRDIPSINGVALASAFGGLALVLIVAIVVGLIVGNSETATMKNE